MLVPIPILLILKILSKNFSSESGSAYGGKYFWIVIRYQQPHLAACFPLHAPRFTLYALLFPQPPIMIAQRIGIKPFPIHIHGMFGQRHHAGLAEKAIRRERQAQHPVFLKSLP